MCSNVCPLKKCARFLWYHWRLHIAFDLRKGCLMRDTHAHSCTCSFFMRDTHAHVISTRDTHANLFFMRDAHAHAFSMRDTHAHGFSMRDAHANLFFMRDTHAHVFSWGTLMFRPPSQLHDNTYRPFFHVIVMSWSHLIHAFFHPLGPSSFVMHQTLLNGCHANGQWMAAPGRTSNLKTRMRMASTLTKCPWQHHISTKELVLWNLHPSRWQKLSQHSYSKTCAAHTSTCLLYTSPSPRDA